MILLARALCLEGPWGILFELIGWSVPQSSPGSVHLSSAVLTAVDDGKAKAEA